MHENSYNNAGYANDDIELEKKDTNEDNNVITPPIEFARGPDDQIQDRAQWGNSVEFLMSCIAMNVGLGNIWRFPFIAYDNGGGAFLIPYILVLLFLGRPMYYLEMCLGQFCSRGNVKMFESLAPVLKGVGYGQLIGTICVATYYCSLMAITLFYLINSFTSNLPWSECNPVWDNESFLQNLTCVASKASASNLNNTISSAELWFRIEVLKESPNINDGIGSPEWRLTLCLLVSWIITFAVCAKGVQTSGKASYFLAIFPYVILGALLIRAVTLEGSAKGILYFVEPKWEMLLNAKLFALLFFFMLFILGVGSLVALKGCAFTVVMDSFPHLKIWHVSLATAVGGFLVGLVYITPGGQWIFTMVDFFGGTFIFYVLTIIEIVSVMWWYGLENICLDIEYMLKKKPGAYWRICWCVVIPLILIIVFFYFLITLEELTYEKKPYPTNIIVWGWALLGFGVIQPLVWLFIEVLRRHKDQGYTEAVKSLFQHDSWGPKDLNKNKRWQEFKAKAKHVRVLKNRSWIVDKLCILIGKE
ncbi:hypothetical protein NQ314_010969 [Rhamnusium bicolor]|uniref:Transporter n=1 Tax=Rhamnusium bicolor TaxID=1586634 RepID=A0AAV8XN43_9CUCU|nr:hypothetical protein NQ314_010969 [Rhamnusium bicolor]